MTCPYCGESLGEKDVEAMSFARRVQELLERHPDPVQKLDDLKVNPGWGNGNPTVSVSFEDDARGIFLNVLRKLKEENIEVVAVNFDTRTVMVSRDD